MPQKPTQKRVTKNLQPQTLSKMRSSKRLQTVPTTIRYAPKKGAEAIANNNDLLAQILVGLPVKSLLRFKSVSKGWYSLISDPSFSRRLLPDSVVGFFLSKNIRFKIEYEFLPLSDKPLDAPFKSLTFDDNPCGLKILQSCNGLLCCSKVHAYSNKHDYYIFNPTTKQFSTLPQLPIEDTITVFGVGLAFDPTKSPYYEVVFIREPDIEADFPEGVELNDTYQIVIYSSQTRSWRLSGKPFVARIGTQFKGAVYCNGAIHWLNIWDTSSLYFNLEEEKLGKLPMRPIPDGWEEPRRCRYFGESRGHLQLIEIYGPRTTQFDVYEIDSDYSGWFVKYRIDLDPVTVAFPDMINGYLDPSDLNYYMFSVLCVIREANDEESYMVLHIPDKAVQYNLKDGSFKKICNFAPDENDDWGSPLRFFWAHQFIQTLSSV